MCRCIRCGRFGRQHFAPKASLPLCAPCLKLFLRWLLRTPWIKGALARWLKSEGRP